MLDEALRKGGRDVVKGHAAGMQLHLDSLTALPFLVKNDFACTFAKCTKFLECSVCPENVSSISPVWELHWIKSTCVE